jgi:hypothetical protein
MGKHYLILLLFHQQSRCANSQRVGLRGEPKATLVVAHFEHTSRLGLKQEIAMRWHTDVVYDPTRWPY